MDVSGLMQFEFETFFLVFARIMAFFVAAPTFSMRSIPVQVKISLGLVLTVMVFGTLTDPTVNTSSSLLGFSLMVLQETILGLAIGYLANLSFLALNMGGQFIDFQMGLSIGAIYDPTMGTQSTLFGSLYNWMAMLLLFAIDGHHLIIYAIVQSFTELPAGVLNMSNFVMTDIVVMFTSSIKTAFQISMPILVVLLLTDIIMGIIARTVPQLQVFVLAVPVKIVLGIMFIIVMADMTFSMAAPIIQGMPNVIMRGIASFM